MSAAMNALKPTWQVGTSNRWQPGSGQCQWSSGTCNSAQRLPVL